eukprot:m51a1_g2043 hypothetical protein (804) ;mRNA; f:1363158-1366428
MEELLVNLDIENPEDPSTIPKALETPGGRRSHAGRGQQVEELWKRFGLMFARYLVVLRRLEAVHDQMAHPQKRLDIRNVLESVLGRTMEIREILCQLRKTDTPDISEFLAQLRLTPDAIELRVPSYFTESRSKLLAERERQFDLLLKMAISSAASATGSMFTPEEESAFWCQALLRLKNRAKEQQAFTQKIESEAAADSSNGLGTAADVISEAKLKEKLQARLDFPGSQKQLTMSDHKAALTIQRREAVFLGMRKNIRNKEDDPVEHAAENAARRKLIQAQNEEEYRQAISAEREQLMMHEGPEMREAMRDEIVHWFLSNKEQFGKRTQETGRAPPPEPVIPASFFLTDIHSGGQKYAQTWQAKDETKNLSQKHDSEMLRQMLRPEIEKEIRKELDEALRSELDSLRQQVEKNRRQRRQKKKKGPGGKEEENEPTVYTIGTDKQAARKVKGGKRRRTRRDDDPTANRTLESLYAELIQKHILVKAPKTYFVNIIGAYNYMADVVQKQEGYHEPTPWDTKQAVIQIAALPMASEIVHAHCPPVRNVLLYGPRGSGKTTLVHATATETGSLFLDLTPSRAAENYSDKDIRMLMSAVFKVAREHQPSVIAIFEVEKLFVKAKGGRGTRALDGNKFRKELLKSIKSLKPSDRVILFGVSSSPATGGKALVQMFDRFLYVNHPDYPTRMKLWQHFIEQCASSVPPTLNVSTLARVSEGYTAGSIEQAVKSAFAAAGSGMGTGARKAQPTPEEYISQLAKLQPVYQAEDEELRKWAEKLPSRDLPVKEPAEPQPQAKQGGDKKAAGKKQ